MILFLMDVTFTIDDFSTVCSYIMEPKKHFNHQESSSRWMGCVYAFVNLSATSVEDFECSVMKSIPCLMLRPHFLESSPQYDTSKSGRGFEASNVPQSIFVPCSFMVHSIAGVGHLLMRSDQVSKLLSISRQDKLMYTFRHRNVYITLLIIPYLKF